MLPPGIHDCTLTEIRGRLCWNPRRQEIFDGLCAFIVHEWAPLGIAAPLLVDGSFVRDKSLPADVDVVLDLSAEAPAQAISLALSLRFRHDEIKLTYNVDVWTRHPLIPNDLVQFFQYLGDKAAAELCIDCKHLKGILRIQP
ncbi:MAG TPA: hypothetical protein PLC14_17405 [Accumulibacter sp.]|uniref:DUF6932 family protein n=1 Tax=Accumulibacter sp. TaxID=2053492 RepID=UPI002CFB63FB|nr:hypothetical protein [Accumulibacter sp.]HRE72288.1 hypothetical protein [Accumulibacter sp.]